MLYSGLFTIKSGMEEKTISLTEIHRIYYIIYRTYGRRILFQWRQAQGLSLPIPNPKLTHRFTLLNVSSDLGNVARTSWPILDKALIWIRHREGSCGF